MCSLYDLIFPIFARNGSSGVQDGKNKTAKPKVLIHDGLWSYDEAFQKEYFILKDPQMKTLEVFSQKSRLTQQSKYCTGQ
jgi:hypothetical protein